MEIGSTNELKDGELQYFVTGAELGETKLSVTSEKSEKLISSPTYSIQVNILFSVSEDGIMSNFGYDFSFRCILHFD